MFVVGNNVATTKYGYFESIVEVDMAAKVFLERLHFAQDQKHPGHLISLTLENDERIEDADEEVVGTNTFASYSVDEIIEHVNENLNQFSKPANYIAVNEFKGIRRKAEQLYSIHCMPIDLDFHEYDSEEELQDAIKETMALLTDAWNSGILPVPTIITYTGRGLGLFYVLDRSLNAKAKSLINYFHAMYKLLRKMYIDFLKDNGSKLELDEKVKDEARVMRIPGYINYKNNMMCQLFSYEGPLFNLNAFKSIYNTNYKGKSKAVIDNNGVKYVKDGKALKMANIISLDAVKSKNLCVGRLSGFNNIRDFKEQNGLMEGYRELLCFLYYNAAVQVYDRTEAKSITYDFNDTLSQPISKRELLSIFSTVDDNVGEDGHRGYYKISNEWIKESLGLSYDEFRNCGFGIAIQNELRDQAKDETANNKNIIKGIIEAIITDNPMMKRADQVALVNAEIENKGIIKRNGKPESISIKTFDRYKKQLGLNKPGTLAYEETSEFKREKIRKESFENKKIKKFPKIVSGCCSVPAGSEEVASIVSLSNDEVISLFLSRFDTLNQMLSLPVDKWEQFKNMFLDKFNEYKLSFKVKAAKGFNFLLDKYSEYDLPYDKQFFVDVDAFIRSVSIGKLSIKINGQIVPSECYLKGVSFNYKTPEDIARELDLKAKESLAKHNANNSSFKFNYDEYMHIDRYEHITDMKLWLEANGFKNVLRTITGLIDIDANIYRLFNEYSGNIGYARKDDKLKKLFLSLQAVLNDDMSDADKVIAIDMMFKSVYGKNLADITFVKVKRTLTATQKDAFRKICIKWDWLKNHNNKSKEVVDMQFEYMRINKFIKGFKDATGLVCGVEYDVRFIKKVLNALTIQEIEESATWGIHDQELLGRWIANYEAKTLNAAE